MGDPASFLTGYGGELGRLIAGAQTSDRNGRPLAHNGAVDALLGHLSQLGTGRLLFIGNGGSAGIASHLAIDYQKNGGFPTICFTDGAALTCIGNDLGFDQVFAAPLKAHARAGDILFAISSSGRSPDILNGVRAARERGAVIVTLSGFTLDNPLRSQGDLNFFIDSKLYGHVEIAHLAICHAVLDMHMELVSAQGEALEPRAETQKLARA